MNAASLANLKPLPQVRPEGMERVEVDVFLHPAQAKRWRRMTPEERGEAIASWLEGQ